MDSDIENSVSEKNAPSRKSFSKKYYNDDRDLANKDHLLDWDDKEAE